MQLAHAGPCADLQQSPACPRNCSDQPASTVCASNGNAYRNLCEMERQTCGQRVVVADLEHCQTTR